MTSGVYSFVFRGLLAEAALDKTERRRRFSVGPNLDAELFSRLPIDALDEDLVARATRMATVYVAIAAFENSVREFVSKVLLEGIGADWWAKVSEKIRTKAESRREEESRVRWHTPRGDEPINYTEFGDLAAIMNQNWTLFENHLQSLEWARQIIGTLERSRNVIMHSGDLGIEDIERIGTSMRDWLRQVGA